jgi:hypothetical protein
MAEGFVIQESQHVVLAHLPSTAHHLEKVK